MLGWLRKKKADLVKPHDEIEVLTAILESGSSDMILETTRQLIRGLNPNGCVMTMVGYSNMKHVNLSVSKSLRLKQTEAGETENLLPDTIEGYARFLANTEIPNEPTRWRFLWFLHGLLLMKSEELSERQPVYDDVLADTWVHLIEGSRVLKTALEHNVLWKNDEKYWWFDDAGNARDDISTERRCMIVCANHVMPKRLCANDKVIGFLKPLDIRPFHNKSGFSDWNDMGRHGSPPPGWAKGQS